MGKLENHRKSNKIKEIIIFILFEIIFTGVTALPFALYGPFKNVRNTIISTIMGTGAHQYIAKWFFNDAQIAAIIKEENRAENAIDNNKKGEPVKVQYNDDGIAEYRPDTDKFNAIVLVIKNPKRVKIGYSSHIGYVGDTTHDIAKRYNALAAINGGYYEDTSGNGTGAIPSGFVISDGKIVYPKDSSKLDDKMDSVMSIDEDGNLSVGGSYSANELIKNNVKEAFVTEPYVIKDGENKIQENEVLGLHPRTVIGQAEDKSIIFLTIDGRQGLTKVGASLKDVQNLMRDFKAVNAVCLDGGGSTTMYYKGEVINNPSSATGERAVPDILYVEQ
ncbi:phosphodiester glycosidase family protein [Clostridium neuense]|uniref:Phosphodiester glycosidase family protein n=1 Tax=Clostridium neuense TaxID=1728934 RepID=A0ABW8TK38_9CLOT